ncbi:MAG: DUF502 domain-containing protein [Planctomycetes bacterium]|nr:DUF502 domain-containing protein [Planctomycetota bacterium]
MKNLFKNFLKGCLVIVPAGVTVWLIWSFVEWVVDKLDNHLISWPLLVVGFLSVALIGDFASNAIGKRLFGLADWILTKLPIVNFLYTTLRDVLRALVGESAAFEKPVMVSLSSDPGAPRMLGFVTCDDLSDFGTKDHVAVYFPQSFNFAGNVLVFPRENVHPLEVEHGKFMSFLLSGGVVQGGGHVPTGKAS